MRNRTSMLSELLEPRFLFDAALEPEGLLRVTGTAGADVIGIALSAKTGKIHVDINGTLAKFEPASITSVQVDLKEGNDRLDIGGGVGNVYVLGGLGEDTLVGGPGNDTLVSGGGKDLVFGGDGDDRLDGGPTADRVFGEIGADRIYGGDANDALDGGPGVDRLFAENGNDVLVGGSSNDKLYGDAGNDSLYGGNQNDLLSGGDDEDDLFGGPGTDTLNGQNGDDILNGEADGDVAFGDAGEDTLNGGGGADSLTGGDGDDTLRGSDGNDSLYGSGGADWLYGEGETDLLDGGDQNDSLSGGVGNDQLYGGVGNDALLGGDGGDALAGNGGMDRLYSQDTDSFPTRSSIDAVFGFADGDVQWLEEEIWSIDIGLAKLQARTGNSKLIKFAAGDDAMVFRRFADVGTDTLAVNLGDGRIDFGDLTFTEPTLEPWVTAIHEIGHNYDSVDENPTIGEFFDISHWRRVGGVWTYNQSSQFAREYGKTNPLEDYATSLEVYFSEFKSPSLWQAKWNYINGWLDSLAG